MRGCDDDPVTISRIIEVAEPGPDFDAVYRDMLAPNFPEHELEPAEVIAEGIAAGTTSVLVALDGDGHRLGAAIGDWDADHRVQLLTYLAVDGRRRAGGVGGRLLDAARQRWVAQYRPLVLLAEVEHPATEAGEAAWGDPRRRFDFYVRRGARVLDLPYFQPALGQGAKRGYGMLLITLYLDDEFRESGTDRVPAAPVRGFLEAYLRECEGGVADDAATTALLAACDEDRGIGLLDPVLTSVERLPRSTSQAAGLS